MRGQVLGVDRRTGEGQVAGDDGRRYSFGPGDWADRGEPRVGTMVDFAIDADRALSLFPLPGSPPPVARRAASGPVTDRSRMVAALLAFFLGLLGVHRFYVGRIGSGVVMLILSLSVIGLFLSAPWALVDTLRYLLMSDGEFARRYGRPA